MLEHVNDLKYQDYNLLDHVKFTQFQVDQYMATYQEIQLNKKRAGIRCYVDRRQTTSIHGPVVCWVSVAGISTGNQSFRHHQRRSIVQLGPIPVEQI